MAVLTVGVGSAAVDLPTPSEMKLSISDVDAASTTRNANGYLIRDRVRGAETVVHKIECTWKGMRIKAVAEMYQAISAPFFTLTYPDTFTGEVKTGTFYVGDRSSDVIYIDSDGENAMLDNISINFIEQ